MLALPQSSTIDTSNRWFLLLLSSGKSLTSNEHWRHSIQQNLRIHRVWHHENELGVFWPRPSPHVTDPPRSYHPNLVWILWDVGTTSVTRPAAAACCWFWLRWQQLHAQCRHNLVTSAHVYTVQVILHCSVLTFFLHIMYFNFTYIILWSSGKGKGKGTT